MRLWTRIGKLARGAYARVTPFLEQQTLVALMLIFGLSLGFAMIADEVAEGETHRFDTALLLALRNPADRADPIGPGWVEEMGRDFSALGGVGPLTLIVVAVAVFLWLRGRHGDMWLVLASVGGGQLLSSLFKHGFDRPRPELVPHEALVYTASFPSGHSMMSAVTYLTLGALLARMQPRRTLKIYLMGLATLLTVAIGVSRVYLGVHWPTDVLAGWTAGAAWALICWTTARWLQVEGRIAPPEPE